ncbi:MAG: hypothetical protein ACRDQ7_06080 [Haloechinothrix sp.]
MTDDSHGARALAKRRRTLALVVTLALVFAAIGWGAGRTIQSPDEAARNASAPQAVPITVPVELQVLESSIVTRGDLRFAQAIDVEVVVDLGDGAGDAPVVTGLIPHAGDELDEGDVAIEVSGRPVFLLGGGLPMYRALRPGLSGNDIQQLEEALARLGHFSGRPDSAYNGRTAAAMRRLYESVGYEPVGPPPEQEQQLLAAREAVDAAEDAHRAAEDALEEALAPLPPSVVLAAEGAVEEARLAYEHAVTARDRAVAEGAEAAAIAELEEGMVAAENRLEIAQAQLDELTAPSDAEGEAHAVEETEDDLGAAERTLARLEEAAGARVPRGEVVFAPSLPRRVDQVSVSLGDVLSGPVMSLTGAELRATVELSREEAGLIDVGQEVRLDDSPSGVDLIGTVTSVADSPGTDGASAGRYPVVVTPDGGDPAELAGLNMRVTIPIESTNGEVLAVPLAALVTDAAGATRVRADRGDRFEEVAVVVGLAAGGLAEVSPVDGALAAGDLVVVGSQR